MSIKELQKNFQSAILKNNTAILKNISESSNLSPKNQLQIYQNGYQERLIGAMKQDFPIIAAILGDNAFSSLVTDYIAHYPSTHFNLRYIGKNLGVFFLEKDVHFAAFSDLAKLEYLMCHADASEEIYFESPFNAVAVYNAFHDEGRLIQLAVCV
jgi:hypothetical protein